jgi:DNA polymerase-3 subunit epsilon
MLGSGRDSVDEDRWVLLDVETTGLDPRHEDLLCVAALAMHRQQSHWQLVLADRFECVIRPRVVRAREDNVLLHRMGWGVQAKGAEPAPALQALVQWIGASPVWAFHADFDRAFVQQALRRQHLQPPAWMWLDLADILPLAFPECPAHSLDEWFSTMKVSCLQRHQAAADVWATAQLWLMMAARVESAGPMRLAHWRRKVQQGRWLRRLQGMQ